MCNDLFILGGESRWNQLCSEIDQHNTVPGMIFCPTYVAAPSIPNPCRNEQSKHTTRRHRKNHSSICAHLWYLLPIIVSPCTTPFPNHPKIRNTTFNTKNLSNFQIFTYVYFSCFFFILLYRYGTLSRDSLRKLHA